MKYTLEGQHQRKNLKSNITIFVIAFICFFIMGVVFIKNIWNTSMKAAQEEAIKLATTAESVFPKYLLTNLEGNSSDINKAEYKALKNSLMNLTYQQNEIYFAYIYIEKNNKIYILADSEPIDSSPKSAVGQEYSQASESYFSPLKNGQTVLTKSISDRWGKWTSILVPMKNRENGEIIAVFGVDYPAEYGVNRAITRTFQAAFVVLCILIVMIVLFLAFIQNLELKIEKKKLIDSETKFKESEMLFRTIFDQATIGIAIGHNNKYIVSGSESRPSINPMFEKILGRTKEELKNISWADITYPEDLLIDLEKFEKFKSGEINGYDLEKRYIKADGSVIWIHMIVSHLYNISNYNHLCIVEDISERKEMEKILYDSERSKAVLLNNLPGMAYRCNYDKDWTMQFVSEGCFALTGYKAESLLHNKEITYNNLIRTQYQEHLWKRWLSIVKEGSKLKEEYELITASGEVKWVFEQGMPIYDENGNVLALEGLIIDITKRKKQEVKLKYINDHDTLTGLYNRRYFEEMITQELMCNNGEKKAVLMLKLKKFSSVNLTFGYAFGEKLIKELVDNLYSLCTDNCQLFDISFDRFIFYVRDYKNKKELISLCKNITEILNATLASKTFGGSIGVVEIKDLKCEADSILKSASIAAENVSEKQILRYNFFDKKMEEKILREAEIKNELEKEAFREEAKSIFVEYQPILDLKTNRISGFEALARLKTDELGFVSPIEFIPIAEETQLIVPIGKKIMCLVFRFLKQLEQKQYNTITISFNVSAIQLLRDDFLPDLIELINETKVNPSKLIAEITESIFLNNYQEINKKLEKIKELGIKISIDDFGTGYSSLARARELNVDYLKIDKYFIDKLIGLDSNKSITGDIISMTHKLGNYVIAEGVEKEVQKQYLVEHNCDFMQGYLFSKPLSMEAAIEILNEIN